MESGELEVTELPQSQCPSCGARINRCVDMNGCGQASPGDLSVCIECGAINEYDETMLVRAVPLEKITGPDFEDARRLQAQVRARFH